MVNLSPCLENASSELFIVDSSGSIRLAGTPYCLDAGPKPANGAGLMLQRCGDLPQQTWGFTLDGLIGTLDCTYLELGWADI